MMSVSAVGVIFSSVPARIGRGKPPASAESVAVLAVLRKSRRVIYQNMGFLQGRRLMASGSLQQGKSGRGQPHSKTLRNQDALGRRTNGRGGAHDSVRACTTQRSRLARTESC